MEVWKDVQDYEGLYQVSDLGRVKSLERYVKGRDNSFRLLKERILKPIKNDKYGHLLVNLSKDCKMNAIFVHRLVLLAFVGPCPKGMEACHNDGNPLNNKLSNLRWDTRKNNVLDMIKHGTNIAFSNEDHYRCKISNKDVIKIRNLYLTGNYTHKELGEMFGCDRTNIGWIVRNKGRNL